MQYQVPQFIDIEDKIIGPLTLKQFGYVAGGAFAVGMLYFVFKLWVVIFFGLPIMALALALAFVKINNRPFIFFVKSFVMFNINPQLYLWQKVRETPKAAPKAAPILEQTIVSAERLSERKLHELAASLDVGSTSEVN